MRVLTSEQERQQAKALARAERRRHDLKGTILPDDCLEGRRWWPPCGARMK